MDQQGKKSLMERDFVILKQQLGAWLWERVERGRAGGVGGGEEEKSRTEMCGPGSVRTVALIRTEQLLLLQRSLREGRRTILML